MNGKMVSYEKWKRKWFQGNKIGQIHSNQINLHLKVTRNHRTVINNNKANFHTKTPMNISATCAITNLYINFLNRIPRESGQILYKDSASLTDSYILFVSYYQKISTGEQIAPRNSAYRCILWGSWKVLESLIRISAEFARLWSKISKRNYIIHIIRIKSFIAHWININHSASELISQTSFILPSIIRAGMTVMIFHIKNMSYRPRKA